MIYYQAHRGSGDQTDGVSTCLLPINDSERVKAYF